MFNIKRTFLITIISFFLIVPNWLKAIDLPIVSNLKIYQTVYCMLIPSYVLTNKSFADILTGYTSIGASGSGKSSGQGVIEALSTPLATSLAASNLVKYLNTLGPLWGSAWASVATAIQGFALTPSSGCNFGWNALINKNIDVSMDSVLDNLSNKIQNFTKGGIEDNVKGNVLLQIIGSITAQASTNITADGLIWLIGKEFTANKLQNNATAMLAFAALESVVKGADAAVLPAYGVVNLPDIIIGQGSYLDFVSYLIYIVFGIFVFISFMKLRDISSNIQINIGFEYMRFVGGTLFKMAMVSFIAYAGFGYLYKISYSIYFGLAGAFGLNQVLFWALDLVLNYTVNSILPAVRAVFSNVGNNAPSLLQGLQVAGISLFAIFMQVTIIMRISTVVVKPLIAGAFSGIVFPIAVCLIVLDWFKDSMKNILIWFINNLFILVLAIPILLFGVLALLAFNLTITPSVAIQNINQGGLGIDSTIASLITLFILKGFIETIIESVNAIVNTIFSSVSMDGSRMDRERDALMVGRVGGSMFKG